MASGLIRALPRYLLLVAELVFRPNRAPVFVLGHQKSGTTAVAALLGGLTNQRVVLDLRREISDQIIPRILRGEANLEELIQRNREEFSAPIIKHPNLTWLFSGLSERFPQARFVFVVRHPADNIRSILDRLELTGTGAHLSAMEWHEMSPAWRTILGHGETYSPNVDHLDELARRWNAMVDIYLGNRTRMTLVRYEDFLNDKEGLIRRVADSVGLAAKGDIRPLVNRQFQPQGSHRFTPPEVFFGRDNLHRITEMCVGRMEVLGYGRA
jgi:hypothetical protein